MSVAPGKTPVSCPQCGKSLMVPVAAIGKQGRCPACTHQFRIEAPLPAAEALPVLDADPIEDDLPQLAPLASDPYALGAASGQTLPSMAPASYAASPFAPGGPLAATQQAPAAALNPYLAAPAAEKANKYNHGFGLEQKAWDMGMLGGVLMMVIAVVWFVVGLMFDYIFFYPPILFIIGVAALIRGFIKTVSG
jgi:hypothetical protein